MSSNDSIKKTWDKLPTWAKWAIPIGGAGLLIIIWAPWRSSSKKSPTSSQYGYTGGVAGPGLVGSGTSTTGGVTPVSTSPVSTSPVSISPVSTSPVSTSPVSTSPVKTNPGYVTPAYTPSYPAPSTSKQVYYAPSQPENLVQSVTGTPLPTESPQTIPQENLQVVRAVLNSGKRTQHLFTIANSTATAQERLAALQSKGPVSIPGVKAGEVGLEKEYSHNHAVTGVLSNGVVVVNRHANFNSINSALKSGLPVSIAGVNSARVAYLQNLAKRGLLTHRIIQQL